MRLLEDARRQGVRKFITVSTDEVYGQILEGAYAEDAPLNPRNPYAASKAGADALTQAYAHTFKMWTAVTRTENNYGPYQHRQKAIPLFVERALTNRPLPVYGDGKHVRQWLHVDDHVTALRLLLDNSDSVPSGEVWHIAGSQELTNTQLADMICKTLGKPRDLITYIDDMNIRPGHDRRYALSCEKMHQLGWRPLIELESGIQQTVRWYEESPNWLNAG
jgi:dTDP-glucose 4,6-dehydratase